ncbi:ABC transporter related [Candidatus Moduliflexus flocculans]|uniref:ABC transporter related n=1 Tax=Candidatus Moduliflexus flocculans TaxID=1499966 RepID=A0A081BPJ5_9BACT|nr:ABC transporter related [Candidatus Moduliflexus flocculans]
MPYIQNERPIKILARQVSKIFSTTQGTFTALHDFNLEVHEGEFLCIVGPSGCGKSTFLRILAGLLAPTSGEIQILPGANPKKPLNNIVFQEYAIFPWKKVIDNVAFGLEMRGYSKKERHEIAHNWLERVGLRKFAFHYPYQLSGGMKQRVSIARALANDPEVLLMDEPLGALDAQTRNILQDELLHIWQAYRKTVVYITHGIEESVLLGDRIILMTAQPGTNKADIEVDIPRPRDLKTTSTARFAELSYQIWEALRDEVTRAMEAQR